MQRLPKIIKIEEEEKKEFHFNKKVFYLILVIIAFIFGVYGLFFSSFFRVKNIDLKGVNLVDGGKVKEVVEFALKDNGNIFLYDGQMIADKIQENFPLISEVDIQKGIPDTIRVVIKERQPAAVWQTGDKRYLIDQNGYAYLEALSDNSQGMPLIFDRQNIPIKLSDKILSKSFLDFSREIQEKFNSRSNLKLKEIGIRETTFDLEVVTEDGFVVLFDTERSAEVELDDLRRVVAHLKGVKPKEYIDLRVEGWAYYK